MADAVKWRIAVILVAGLANNLNSVEASEEIMTKMTKTFFNVIEECKSDLKITKNMMDSFVKFFEEGSQVEDRDLGCVIICMVHKQDLLHQDKSGIHKENAYQFARDHGADEEKAKQIVDLVQECEGSSSNPDHCLRALEVARCFRDHLHRLKWMPPVDLLMGEISADIQ